MISGARRLVLVAAVLAVIAWTAEAFAESRKVLFVAAAPSPWSARVRAEIEAMGFEIEPAAALAEDAPATAIAAARVIESPSRRVELWIADSRSGRFTLRALVLPGANDDDETETVRASEQLRAFFQPLRQKAPPPSPSLPTPFRVDPPVGAALLAPKEEATPIAQPKATPAESRPRFVLAAGLAVPFQPGGPSIDVDLRGRWMATRVLGLGAFVTVPLAGSKVTDKEGTASIAAALFGGEITAAFEATSWLRLSTSLGAALAWVRTTGFASSPYHGRSSDVTSALGLLGAGIAPRLTERTRLAVDGRIGFTAPRVDIAFAGRNVATWGRPLGMVSAGVSVDL